MTCFNELQLHITEIWLYGMKSKRIPILYCLLLHLEHNDSNGRLLVLDFSDTYMESSPTVRSVITWTDTTLRFRSP